MSTTTVSPRLPPNTTRLPNSRWPFLNDIVTDKICRYAGRESSLNLAAALGNGRKATNVARANAFYEPFSYSDWTSNPPTNTRRPKNPNTSTLTPSQRWQAFKKAVETVPSRGRFVKRIATAKWMTGVDLLWIAKYCTKLEALDLSDYSQAISPDSADISDSQKEDLKRLLGNLTWLGLSDSLVNAPHNSNVPQTFVEMMLAFLSVTTLCIRGEYSLDKLNSVVDDDSDCADLINGLQQYCPETVTTLELRLPIALSRTAVDNIQLKARNIRHIGIDLGSLAQMYSQNITREIANGAATMEKQATVTRVDEVIRNSQSMMNVANRLLKGQMPSFIDMVASYIQAAIPEEGYSNSFDFVPLDPESHTQGSDPINPLVLLHEPKTASATQVPTTTSSHLLNVYLRLDEWFRWRPVFDWTLFMNLYPDWPTRFQHKDATIPADYPSRSFITDLAKQLRFVRDAGVPLHLLIRSPENSPTTLLWGLPFSGQAYTFLLQHPFNAHLEHIAPLIDTLSILYDVHSPVFPDTMKDIHDLEPIALPKKRKRTAQEDKQTTTEAPVRKRPNAGRKPAPSKAEGSHPQRYRIPLAPMTTFHVPAHEHADDYNSDDSDYETDTTNKEIPLTHLSRRAAYIREALIWHRFWTKYSPLFTALTELNVRMPACFDKVKTCNLAALLNKNKGWVAHMYAYERQAVYRYAEDSVQSPSHEHDFTAMPGGKFVRRTWIKHPVDEPVAVPARDRSAQINEEMAAGIIEATKVQALLNQRNEALKGKRAAAALEAQELERLLELEIAGSEDSDTQVAPEITEEQSSPPEDQDADAELEALVAQGLFDPRPSDIGFAQPSSSRSASRSPSPPPAQPKKGIMMTAAERRLLGAMNGAAADSDSDEGETSFLGGSGYGAQVVQDDEDTESVDEEMAEREEEEVVEEVVVAAEVEEERREERTVVPAPAGPIVVQQEAVVVETAVEETVVAEEEMKMVGEATLLSLFGGEEEVAPARSPSPPPSPASSVLSEPPSGIDLSAEREALASKKRKAEEVEEEAEEEKPAPKKRKAAAPRRKKDWGPATRSSARIAARAMKK